MGKRINIKDGVFYINDKPHYFVSAEYPYYRDSTDLWDEKLKSIKKLGSDFLSFYVPWRHHFFKEKNKITVDFNGKTALNRNLIKFLKLCKKNKLYVLIKPGPFIHAETRYGGLIDDVNPSINKKIETMTDINNNPCIWIEDAIPSPADKVYRKYIKQWFKSFTSFILNKYSYPDGPIVAIQIANEGIYTNSSAPVDSYDFSKSALKLFSKKFKTGRVAPWAYPEKRKDVMKYYKWSNFQSHYVYDFYKYLIKNLKSNLPYMINLNPFVTGSREIDSWFSRNNIETWKGIQYGYTNWMGLVAYDDEAYYRYLILIKRSKGFNVEENWGFSKLYDKRYYYPIIPYFQTLLIMAGGSKGFNIYTTVGTEHWDENVDNRCERPYPSSPPITPDNKKANKYKTLKSILDFIKKNKENLLSAEPVIDINYAFYPDEFYFSAWDKKGKDSYWKKFGFNVPFDANKKILNFITFLRKSCIDFNFVNLRDGELNTRIPQLFISSGLMDEKVEEKIIRFVKKGGNFILAGEPRFNLKWEKLNKLKELIENKENKNIQLYKEKIKVYHSGKGRLVFYPYNPLKGRNYLKKNFRKDLERIFYILDKDIVLKYDSTCEVFLHFSKKGRTHILYMFNKMSKNKECSVKVNHKYLQAEIKVLMVSRGAVVLVIKNKKIVDMLCKNENEYDKRSISKTKVNMRILKK